MSALETFISWLDCQWPGPRGGKYRTPGSPPGLDEPCGGLLIGAAQAERFPARNQPASPRRSVPGRETRNAHWFDDVIAHLQRLRYSLRRPAPAPRECRKTAQVLSDGEDQANWGEYDACPVFVQAIFE